MRREAVMNREDVQDVQDFSRVLPSIKRWQSADFADKKEHDQRQKIYIVFSYC